MKYIFRKDDFVIDLENQDRRVLVSVSNNKDKTYLIIVYPGNVYYLKNGEWDLIDIRSMIDMTQEYHNSVAVGGRGLVMAMTRVPIGNSYLPLNKYEMILIYELIYDMTLNRHSDAWFPKSTEYYLKGNHITLSRNGRIEEYDITGDYVRETIQKQMKNPKIFSPADTHDPTMVLTPPPGVGEAVILQTKPIQQNMPAVDYEYEDDEDTVDAPVKITQDDSQATLITQEDQYDEADENEAEEDDTEEDPALAH